MPNNPAVTVMTQRGSVTVSFSHDSVTMEYFDGSAVVVLYPTAPECEAMIDALNMLRKNLRFSRETPKGVVFDHRTNDGMY